MPIDPDRPADLLQIQEMTDDSMRRQECWRTDRNKHLKEYVGQRYGDHGASWPVALNLIRLLVAVFTQHLSARAPKALVTSLFPHLHPTAVTRGLVLNREIERVKFAKTARRAVSSAMFLMGIVKVGTDISSSGQPPLPYVEGVLFDDFACDMNAHDFDEVEFIGHRTYERLDDVQDNPLYDQRVTRLLQGDADYSSEPFGEDRADVMTAGQQTRTIEASKRCWLWHVYLKPERLLVTYADTKDVNRPLRVIDYDGPERGPFHVLGFSEVPDNLMPLSPVASLIDLHDLANRLFRKIARQAERAKNVTAFAPGAEDEAAAIQDAEDGRFVKVTDPNLIKQFRSGSIDTASFALALQLLDKFNYFAGNLNTIGGLTTSAETLGQEQMIGRASSQQVVEMQLAFVTWVQDIYQHLMWEVDNGERMLIPVVKKVRGTDIQVNANYLPGMAPGAFDDYRYRIHPYSGGYKSPAERLQMLLQIFERYVMPLGQMGALEQQSLSIDINALFDMIGEYGDMEEELGRLLIASEEPFGTGGTEGMRMPPNTKRTYERVNRPGATESGKIDTLTRALLGAGQQDSELAAAMRPTG